MASKNSIDMVNGPLWGKIMKFAATFMLTAIIQHLYNTADTIIVGRYAGREALAGVGTCTVLVKFFINFILGMSAGTTVVIGQAIGSGNRDNVGKAVHTAIAVAIAGGGLVTIICNLYAKELLTLISVPEDVMHQASLYLRVISVGFIPSLIYNFSASILRAKGDTKRALYIVSISGIINVGLNLLFVCGLKMKADGVAAATVVSQFFTAIAMIYILCNEHDETRLQIRKIKFYKEPLKKVLRYGIPSGIQSSVYSISNMIVQSSVNSFGSAAIAGSAAVANITEIYNVMNSAVYHSAIVFTSQNYGAKKFERIKKTITICSIYTCLFWAIQCLVSFTLGKTIVSFYAPGDAAVVEMGMRKLSIHGYTYGLMGFMNLMAGALRGIGVSVSNMIMSISGVCGIRLMWIATVFQKIRTIECLYVCYPLSWVGTFIMYIILFCIVFRKKCKKNEISLV